MGVGIEAYRIRIGTFNQTKVSSSKSSFYEKRNCSTVRNSNKKRGFKCDLKILLILLLVFNWAQVGLVGSGKCQHQERGKYDIWNVGHIRIDVGNKYAKRTYGNKRENGIKIIHFNKGNGHLCNKMREIENVIDGYQPHLVGISESNFLKSHDIENVQIPNYKFIPAKTLANPNLNASRVAVYMHDSLVGKVRNDLMDDSFSSICVEERKF